MPEAWTETLAQFSWEGRLTLMQLGMLGLVVGLILVFFAWRESLLIARPRAAWVLLALRLVTLSIVLWALAEPTDVLTEKSFRPKTVGVFLDTSASMGLVDPGDGSGDFQKWKEAKPVGEPSTRVILDQAHGGLVAAVFNVVTAPDAAVLAVEDALAKVNGLALSVEMTSLVSALGDGCLPSMRALSTEDVASLTQLKARTAAKAELDAIASQWRMHTDQLYETAELVSVGEGKESRLNKAVACLTEAEETWMEKLGEEVRVERYHFDSETISLGRREWRDLLSDASDPDKGTDATSWMKNVRRFDAALVISDGVHNTGESPRDLASTLAGVSTLIVPIGDTRLRRDVFLHHVKYPQSVIQKDTLVVEGVVTAHDCQGEKLIVQLVSVEEEVMDQQIFEVAQRMEDLRIGLRWKADTLGMHDFTLRVKPLDEEFSEENNEEGIKVNVIDDEVRVLLAERLPRWEFRYLKSILQRDQKIEMDAILFNPDHSYQGRPRAEAASLPKSLDEWSRYRIALIGDLTVKELPQKQQEQLRQWVVDAGGNLIVIAGDSMPREFFATPLGELFPVRNQAVPIAKNGYQLTVTAEGASTPPVLVAEDEVRSLSVWENVSKRLPVYDLSPFSIPKPTAHVLIQADPGDDAQQALSYLSWQYVGKGRVVHLSAPVAYQLRYRKGDEYHHRFWGQLFRWAIARDLGGGARTVKLSTDKTRYPYRSDVSVRLRLNEMNGLPVEKAEADLLVRCNDELIQTAAFRPEKGAMGVYRAELSELPPGKIRLQVGGSSIDRLLNDERYEKPIIHELIIDPHDSAELRVPLADVSLLRSIADASGGAVISPAGIQAALSQLDLEPVKNESVTRQPLWNRWWLIWLLIGLLLAEWIGRKAFGLV